MVDKVDANFKMILTIVNKGDGTKVVEISKRFGCDGGTILPGKGTGPKDTNFFGIKMDPEKDVVISLVQEHCAEEVLKAISKAVKISKPGTGVSFVLRTNFTSGISHLINE